jgi:hypothetical protein
MLTLTRHGITRVPGEGYETTRGKLKSSVFRDITPCSSLKVNRRFGKLCLPPAFTLFSCSAYSSILKIEATCSDETSVDFQRTARRYIPENRTVHNCRCNRPWRPIGL